MSEKLIDSSLADCMFLIDNKLQVINQNLNEDNEILKNKIKSLEHEKNEFEIRIELLQNFVNKQNVEITNFNHRLMELLSKSDLYRVKNTKKSFIIKNLRIKKKNLTKENKKLKSVSVIFSLFKHFYASY